VNKHGRGLIFGVNQHGGLFWLKLSFLPEILISFQACSYAQQL
jgi:hypothetical protein